MPETPPAAAKRRVLMLCYYFPPIQATGVTRSRSFAENLSGLGWDPIVLTVANCRDPWVKIGTDQAPNVHVERSSEWNLARLADLSHAVMVRIARLFKIELNLKEFRNARYSVFFL